MNQDSYVGTAANGLQFRPSDPYETMEPVPYVLKDCRLSGTACSHRSEDGGDIAISKAINELGHRVNERAAVEFVVVRGPQSRVSPSSIALRL